jgi:hypothetical protein
MGVTSVVKPTPGVGILFLPLVANAVNVIDERVTTAMEAGIADHLWTLEKIVRIID